MFTNSDVGVDLTWDVGLDQPAAGGGGRRLCGAHGRGSECRRAGHPGQRLDPEGHKLRPTLLTLPAHGHLVLALDGSFTYAPDKLFVGVDTFTYRIDDGKLDSGVATVRIAVQAPPVLDVPALDAFGRLLMLLLLGAGGWLALRRHA